MLLYDSEQNTLIPQHLDLPNCKIRKHLSIGPVCRVFWISSKYRFPVDDVSFRITNSYFWKCSTVSVLFSVVSKDFFLQFQDLMEPGHFGKWFS